MRGTNSLIKKCTNVPLRAPVVRFPTVIPRLSQQVTHGTAPILIDAGFSTAVVTVAGRGFSKKKRNTRYSRGFRMTLNTCIRTTQNTRTLGLGGKLPHFELCV